VSETVCLGACSLGKTQAGAYLWMFLNWALGLRATGAQVIWLTSVLPGRSAEQTRSDLAELRDVLRPYGLDGSVVVVPRTARGEPVDGVAADGFEAANAADLFLNLAYHPAAVVERFRRSAFVDIDPGLTQTWLGAGAFAVAPHDTYLTYGETVGHPGSPIPDCGLSWVYTPPPVYLPAWPVTPAGPDRPYTTVSGWWGEWVQIDGEVVDNSKRAAFLDYLDLPARTATQLELALPMSAHESDAAERTLLQQHGWTVRRTDDVCLTPEAHRAYVRQSRGEFGCMKPGYVRLATGWVGERTVNYMASGKPAVIQWTGPSRFLPDRAGLLRFRTLAEAAARLAAVEADYDWHCRAARAVAEEHFDAARVIPRVLDRALG
jgi:hypothetical protein